jgi:hypothetical protein
MKFILSNYKIWQGTDALPDLIISSVKEIIQEDPDIQTENNFIGSSTFYRHAAHCQTNTKARHAFRLMDLIVDG